MVVVLEISLLCRSDLLARVALRRKEVRGNKEV
jgi:hypothetical protein